MHIGLNLLYASPAIGGAWRYIGNVLQMIAKYDQRNSYSLFVYDSDLLPLAAPTPRMQGTACTGRRLGRGGCEYSTSKPKSPPWPNKPAAT